MKSNQTFSIDMIYHRCKADKTSADLFARITVNGESKELSLKIQIEVKDWDSATEMVRGRSVEAKSINDHICEVRTKLRLKYRQLEESDKLITAEAVKKAYTGVQEELRGHRMLELMKYFTEVWKEKLAPGNFKNYKTTIDYLTAFLKAKYSGGDVFLSQVNGEFATNFELFVRTSPIKEHDPCKGNGVGKHLQRFKRMLNWAEDPLKWITKNECANYSCPIKKTKRKKLSLEHVIRIEEKSFFNETISYVKDLFMFSCYAGLAYVDVLALAESDFERENDKVWCYVYRAKTDGLCAIPLLPQAAAILRKYVLEARSAGRAKIFRKISNQQVNDSLKVIKEACEIPVYLTFHIARHTFAKTIALKNGVPLETVQMLLGHTKITTTQIYAEVDEEKILSDTSGLADRIEQKKVISAAVVENRKASVW